MTGVVATGAGGLLTGTGCVGGRVCTGAGVGEPVAATGEGSTATGEGSTGTGTVVAVTGAVDPPTDTVTVT